MGGGPAIATRPGIRLNRRFERRTTQSDPRIARDGTCGHVRQIPSQRSIQEQDHRQASQLQGTSHRPSCASIGKQKTRVRIHGQQHLQRVTYRTGAISSVG